MAEVIKLTDKYIDTSGVYDTNLSKTQQQFNTDANFAISRRMYAIGQADGKNYKELIQNYCKYSSGVYGSISFTEACDGISTSWHWFLYVPHRYGTNESDNYQYGMLFLQPFWASSFYIVRYTSGGTYNVRTF